MAARKEQNPFLGAKINVRKNRSKKGGEMGADIYCYGLNLCVNI